MGRNRGMVLDAARQVFLERGYAGATLEAIAEEAGFSKGVVYSQFAGKPDLFLALLERRIEERAAENVAIAADRGRDRGAASAAARRQRRDAARTAGNWGGCSSSSASLAARDAGAERPLRRRCTRGPSSARGRVCAVLARAGLRRSARPKDFARLIFALDAGSVLERAAGPRGLPRRP